MMSGRNQDPGKEDGEAAMDRIDSNKIELTGLGHWLAKRYRSRMASNFQIELYLMRAQNSRRKESSGKEGDEFSFEHLDIKGSMDEDDQQDIG